MPRESLGELLRSLGQNPTQAEVAALEQNVGATCEWREKEVERLWCMGGASACRWHVPES